MKREILERLCFLYFILLNRLSFSMLDPDLAKPNAYPDSKHRQQDRWYRYCTYVLYLRSVFVVLLFGIKMLHVNFIVVLKTEVKVGSVVIVICMRFFL